MNAESALEGGLTGATTLTILHEIVRFIDNDAPRMDELGKQAIAKIFSKFNLDVPDEDQLYLITSASELISNGLFYSLLGAGAKENALVRGALLGLTAGAGAVFLPGKLGLDNSASDRTLKTKVMTVAWYVIGGIIAAAVTQKLEERKQQSS